MSNESVNYPGGGKSRRRPAERVRRGWSLWLLLAVWIGASSAMAAEIVQVRVGKHAKFTRVVFELDRAAGYRIERNDGGTGGDELIVSLQAGSPARKIRSSKSLISTVEVSPDGNKSVARIQLRQDGLQLKEMILNSPPRIVLDVMSGSSGAASVAKTKAKAKTAAAKTKSVAKATAKAAGSTASKTASAASKATADVVKGAGDASNSVIEQAKAARAAAAARLEASKQAASDKAQAASNKAKDAAKALEAKADATVANTKQASKDAAKAVKGAAQSTTAAVVEGVDKNVVDPMKNAAKGAADTLGSSSVAQAAADAKQSAKAAGQNAADATAQAAAKAKQAAKSPMNQARSSQSQKDSGWMNWALAGVAGLLFVGGGFFMLNRRRGEAVDFEDDEDDVDGGAALDDVNPFASLEPDASNPPLTSEGMQREDSMTPGGVDLGDSDGFALTADDDEEKEQEAVYETGSVEDDMEVISRDDVNDSLGMPPTVGGVPEEFMQLMREMQSKVEGLEGRVEELVDARDRLERQVAAQTEELRVQRAAIARTQRAVRNLARPEDDEQEPTEPALRDPNKD